VIARHEEYPQRSCDVDSAGKLHLRLAPTFAHLGHTHANWLGGPEEVSRGSRDLFMRTFILHPPRLAVEDFLRMAGSVSRPTRHLGRDNRNHLVGEFYGTAEAADSRLACN